MVPASGLGRSTKMAIDVQGQTFRSTTVEVDNRHFLNCTFVDCLLITSGGEFAFENCQLTNCTAGLQDDTAINVFRFLDFMQAHGPLTVRFAFSGTKAETTEVIRDQQYRNVNRDLDGYHYENCTFENCTLTYRGGDWGLTGCRIENTEFQFRDAASNTTNLLNAMQQLGLITGGNQVFEQGA
jgi:hypothetical protein